MKKKLTSYFLFLTSNLVLCISYFVLCISLLSSCHRKEPLYFDGYSRNASGLYYKIAAIGDGKYKAEFWDDVFYSCNFKKQNDSIFFSSYCEKENLEPADTLDKERIQCRFYHLNEGDSLIYKINTRQFFRTYFQTEVPDYCKNDSLITVELKITQVQKESDLTEKNPKLAMELKMMSDYVVQKNIKVIKELPQHIFVLSDELVVKNEPSNAGIVKGGKTITVEYKGYFLNDSLIDNPQFPLQFVYGTPDQLVEGLNFVIKGMCKGETKKIILPSHLTFGPTGSTNGAVPPYTPLIYTIKILEVK